MLDFFNKPEEVLEAFKVYYEAATLLDVSDPNMIWDLEEKLKAAGIFTMTEVVTLSEVFFKEQEQRRDLQRVQARSRPLAARYRRPTKSAANGRGVFTSAKSGDPVLIGNAENDLKEATAELSPRHVQGRPALAHPHVRVPVSQIIDYDSTDLEKLSLFARALAPMLRA